jgi:hypothetical protein
MYSFMSGKSYELYSMVLTQLKEAATEAKLSLNPLMIHCDYEKGAIKAFKLHFQGVKIQGCHFHFTSAIHKKVVEVGLSCAYSVEKAIPEFTTWIRMLMAFPFLVLDDIDDVWDEMKDTCPDTSSKSNVYKILDITKNQETLTSTKFERVNQGQEKKSSNAQHVKDAKIEVLKLKYKHGELDVMDYLLQVSVFSKNYD